MRSWNSPAPTGNENETTFDQGVYRKLKSELQFYDSTTIRVEQTTRGIRFHARPSRRGSTASWIFSKPILYDNTKSYSFQQIVYVAPDDPMVTTGTVDPDTGLTVFAIPGLWVALQAVAPVVNPTGQPAGTYYHIPQIPYPVPNAPDDDLNYWWLVSADAQCYA
jgi:hypothetical protein